MSFPPLLFLAHELQKRKLQHLRLQQKKKAAAPKATTAKKTTATKASTTKKTATKKPAKEPKVKAVFQYQDLEFTEASCIKKANKGADLKNINIYIKPEEGKIYYVANGDINGSVDL